MESSNVVAAGANGSVGYVHGGRLYVGAHRTDLIGVIGACLHWDESSKILYVGAICTDKSACVMCVTSEDCQILSKHFLPKRPSAVRFAGAPVSLIVSDGFGDVFKLPIRESCDVRQADVHEKYCVLGHFALVTDCAVSSAVGNPGKPILLATSDREGRVRLSRFPDCFVVEAFLLYHRTYVTACAWISQSPSTRLLSADGDGTLCLWDVLAPDAPLSVFKFDSSAVPGKSPVIVSVDVHPLHPDYAVVVVDKHPGLYVLRGACSGNELVKVCEYSAEGDPPVSAAYFDSGGQLWVSHDNSKEVTALKVSILGPNNVNFQVANKLEPSLKGEMEGDQVAPGEIHNRIRWLRDLKKKPLVEGWKGKKRKMET